MTGDHRLGLRVAQIHHPVTALGPGRRFGVWLQGCHLACRGCMSKHTWDADGGIETPIGVLLDGWQAALADGADGLTLSGGEPLEQTSAVQRFLVAAAAVRDRDRPEADLLVYTGFTEREARRRAPGVLQVADALITGRYRADRPTRLIWRGSANQELIPLTARGRSLYETYRQHAPERAPLQVGVDGGSVWLIGVPPHGDLERLDVTLAGRGLTVAGSTWSTPPDPPGPVRP